MNLFKSILPHFVIVLSGVFLVFLILDQYNPTMDFIGNPVSSVLLVVFCVAAVLNSALASWYNRRETRAAAACQAADRSEIFHKGGL